MKLDRIRRGDVVRCVGRFLISWSDAAGFPLHPQTRPLHRSEVQLQGDEVLAFGLQPGAWIIDTRITELADEPRRILGQASPELIVRIEAAISRERAANQLEDRSVARL